MKKFRLLFTFLFVAAFASFSFGQELITATAHDFSGAAWSGGEICIACHTPHNGDLTVPGAPLWNHEVTVATYTVYSGTTIDAIDLGQPGGESLLCLSCHDGTVALDSYGGTTGSTTIGAGGLVGTILSDDHPISFTYDTDLSTNDGALHDPATALSGLGTTIDADMLFSGEMQCSSCHDVHGGVSGTALLRVTNAGSLLCLTCHNK